MMNLPLPVAVMHLWAGPSVSLPNGNWTLWVSHGVDPLKQCPTCPPVANLYWVTAMMMMVDAGLMMILMMMMDDDDDWC